MKHPHFFRVAIYALGAALAVGCWASSALAAPPAAAPSTAGRRDPFKLPSEDDASAALMLTARRPPGVHGLLVSELTLQGIVSQDSGREMIAVVTNSAGRTYFLRQNERLFDGKLNKITPQAAYFEETLRDRKGHESVVQVVKWLNSKPGEAQ